MSSFIYWYDNHHLRACCNQGAVALWAISQWVTSWFCPASVPSPQSWRCCVHSQYLLTLTCTLSSMVFKFSSVVSKVFCWVSCAASSSSPPASPFAQHPYVPGVNPCLCAVVAGTCDSDPPVSFFLSSYLNAVQSSEPQQEVSPLQSLSRI